jgi:LemA protein
MQARNKITDLIHKAYGRKYRLGHQQVIVKEGYRQSRMQHQIDRMHPALELLKQNRIKVLILLVILLKTYMAIFYYNLLIDTEQNMLAAIGDVDALEQRRNDIANNLSRAVLDYSQHEQDVFDSVVTLRAATASGNNLQNEQMQKLSELVTQNQPAVADGAAALPQAPQADLISSLAGMVAIAEQYPDLKLSTNFETLMAALVEVEKDLAMQRITLNKETNIYTTNVVKFPCNVFAYIFGFDQRSYFTATEEAKNFKEIQF